MERFTFEILLEPFDYGSLVSELSTYRHNFVLKGGNVTQNQIAYWNLQETKRANEVREGETERSNREKERNNRAVTSENVRHNRAVETETQRHNVIGEDLDSRKVSNDTRRTAVEEGKLSETIRHNVRTEGQEDRRLTETERHNKSSESIESRKADAAQTQANNQTVRTGLSILGGLTSFIL